LVILYSLTKRWGIQAWGEECPLERGHGSLKGRSTASAKFEG
jgi:hypothetical protein